MEEDLLETDIYHHALNLKNQWDAKQTFITLENLNLLLEALMKFEFFFELH